MTKMSFLLRSDSQQSCVNLSMQCNSRTGLDLYFPVILIGGGFVFAHLQPVDSLGLCAWLQPKNILEDRH